MRSWRSRYIEEFQEEGNEIEEFKRHRHTTN
jgi:hypothetical protein